MRTQSLLPGLIARSVDELAVVSNPGTPDRTLAIKGLGPSPLPWLLESARLLGLLGASRVAYPCNTAHYFLHRMPAAERPLPLVDLIEETVASVAAAGHRTVGLLATTGTISTGLYQDAFEARGIAVVVPSQAVADTAGPDVDGEGRLTREAYVRLGAAPDGSLEADRIPALLESAIRLLGEQEGLVMETIRGVFGVKAGFTAGVAVALGREAGRRLVARGADAIVLGCTELPLVVTRRSIVLEGREVSIVDPTRALAERLAAMPGVRGVGGGLGPEATIDLLIKMGAPRDFTDLAYAILRETVAQLDARRDQDHLKWLAVTGPDPAGAARRLAAAGASFLVLSRSAAGAEAEVAAVTGLPVVVERDDRPAAPAVVRAAVAPPVASP